MTAGRRPRQSVFWPKPSTGRAPQASPGRLIRKRRRYTNMGAIAAARCISSHLSRWSGNCWTPLHPKKNEARPTATSATRSRRSGSARAARLEEAVLAYREALKEFTRERVPLDWAAAQNNLGNALRE